MIRVHLDSVPLGSLRTSTTFKDTVRWYATPDGELEIIGPDNEGVIAEFAPGSWRWVESCGE